MISVIIPLYNAESTILAALNSIKAQTADKREFEIIIVNDGSTDGSKKVVESFIKDNPDLKILFFEQANGGVSKARNTGLRKATGEFIALLDSDDEWLPEKTEKQLKFLNDKEINIDFIATRRNNSRILPPYHVKNHLAEITFKKLLLRNEAQPSTVIFKRKILENTGFFNEDQRYAEDLNYWMKISKNNTMYVLDESLLIADGGKRTFGVSGLSADLAAMEKGFQGNLREMHHLNNINFIQYQLLRVFYKAKYLLLLGRTFYYHLKK